MEYRYLGRTGLKVSELCLGAMTFGRESTEEISYQLLDCCAEAGIDRYQVHMWGPGTSIEETLAALGVADNLGATGWSLTSEEVDLLDQASMLPLPYPYESLAQQRAQRGR